MSKDELENLKIAGAHEGMSREINNLIFKARELMERAPYDAYRSFEKNIEQARQMIDDAVQIRNEMLRIPKAKKQTKGTTCQA